MKNIYCIRHGKSAHNLFYSKNGEDAYLDILHTDSSLLEEGFKQCEEINKNYKHIFSDLFKNDDFLIVVSPLKRCLLTYFGIFSEYNIPKKKIVSIELIREYPAGLHTPNKRMSKSTLNYFYDKYIDFTKIMDNEDKLWNSEREETINELELRINEFKEWISERKESNIIIISHSSFLGKLIFNDTNFNIKHTQIYKLNL